MKPRGLMIIHNFRPGPVGGAELQAERLSAQLVRLGHSMQVLTWLTVPDAPQEETCANVQIHRVPHRLPYWVKCDNAKTFRYLVLHRGTYDLLHVHMAFGHAVVAVIVARCFGKKCIIKIACAGQYGDLCTFSRFERFDKALRILRLADAMVAVSSEVEQELLHYGFQAERIVRIPNGVDATYFRRTQPFPDYRKTRFVLIGRRHPQKGIDTALHAARKLSEKGLRDQFEINLYGPDYPEYDYRAMAEELGVADIVRFFPFEKEILVVYQSSHCLLLPSRGEGLSNTLLEAMAMAMPTIATSVSGTQDVIDDGKNGILIPPDSPDMLAAAMSKIISRPDWANLLGKTARQKVETCFSLESVACRYSELYTKLHQRYPSLSEHHQ
ncbi:MAG: glycosyltransferase family 4 protein [Acidobacteriia bacterium]|nr:glycosyltransferase family 4 protein [Terriglobia bacterium]